MTVINTKNAPTAIGPYIQGVNTGKMVITSGQLPVDPLTGMMSAAIEVQTFQSLENVRAIVEAAGLTVANIMKSKIFVKDLNDFSAVNVAYEAFFAKYGAPFKERSSIGFAQFPKDAKKEIEAIAVV